MNLLIDDWIPVRPQGLGAARHISLQTLCCEDGKWELALPRDDMELAALQLLICLAQVLFPPADRRAWLERIAKPLSVETLESAIRDYQDWFKLNHSDHPFMQIRGVSGDFKGLDAMLPGLTGATNTTFVNEPNLATSLCFGCASISLFNRANNAPSFCGGVKAGLRGSTPTTTFAKGASLRDTVMLNVLSFESIGKYYDGISDYVSTPNWIDPVPEVSVKNKIKQGGVVHCGKFSLFRAIFWQPAHIELFQNKNRKKSSCVCCGLGVSVFDSFKYEKFSYEYKGMWEHPHSPQVMAIKKGAVDIRYVSFTQPTPAWTQLSRYVVKRDLNQVGKGEQGQIPAMVIRQIESYLPKHKGKFELLVGGYRNKKASILERRHELLILNQGWESHANIVHELVEHGLKYKEVIAKSLYIFSVGLNDTGREIKGVGLKYKENKKDRYSLQELAVRQYYRRSEDAMLCSLANIDFENTIPTYLDLDTQLKKICESIFTELTSPYEHDLELFHTLAIARLSLQKQMKEIRINPPEKDAA